MHTIALVAPGFAVAPDIRETAIANLRSHGYGVKVFGRHEPADGRFAGTDAARARHLMQAYLDPEIDTIVCMRGGSGCSRILDHLDFGAIARNTKPLIGYSDVTALHMALTHEADNPVIHGPMGIDLLGAPAERSFQVLADIIARRFDTELTGADGLYIEQTGRFSGPLIGGNLTVFLSLIGTPEFHVPDRAVLFFEDVGEYDFRMDRAFVQLRRSGILRKAGACLFGHTRLAGSDDPDAFRQIAMSHLGDVTGPIVFDIPSAHDRMKLALPLGHICRVRANTHSVDLRFIPAAAEAPRPCIAV
ncbi:LD-carboxypeptidase [Sedimentitalea sp.]|uniref:S66 peptidase family protein n=1 Tax=Sedimentitalea sp. TaxID=2048915 RepID=UPI003298D706